MNLVRQLFWGAGAFAALLLAGCGGPAESGTERRVLGSEPDGELVGDSWAFEEVIVFYSPERRMAMGIREGGDDGLEVFPVLAAKDPSGFSDVAVWGERMALVGFEASGDADVVLLVDWDGPSVRWEKADVLMDFGNVRFSDDGAKVVAADPAGNLFVWNVEDGEMVWEIRFDGENFLGFVPVEGVGEVLFYRWDEDEVEVVSPFEQRVVGRFKGRGVPFWWNGALVYRGDGGLFDISSREQVLDLVLEDRWEAVSRDFRLFYDRADDKKSIEFYDLGKEETVRRIDGEIGQDFFFWGDGFVMGEESFYAVYDLSGGDVDYKFWPIWGDGWYLEGADGRWAGSLEAAEVRGMEGEGDSGLVGEFVRLVGLGG